MLSNVRAVLLGDYDVERQRTFAARVAEVKRRKRSVFEKTKDVSTGIEVL